MKNTYLRKVGFFLIIIFLFSLNVSALTDYYNFQPVKVPSLNQNITGLNVSVYDSLGLEFYENFSFPETNQEVSVVLGLAKSIPEDIAYRKGYYYRVQALNSSGWFNVSSLDDTIGYFGRGLINVTDIDNLNLNTAPQDQNISELWVNASDQEGRITSLETILGLTFQGFGDLNNNKICRFNSGDNKIYCDTSLPAADDDTALWANASSQQQQISISETNIVNLWSNASNQDGRIIAVETDMVSLWANASEQETRLTFIDSNVSYLLYNASDQDNRIIFLESSDAENRNNITNLWGNASNQDGRILTLESRASATYTNVTALQENVTSLWSNASNQDSRLITIEANYYSKYGGTIDGNVNVTKNITLGNALYNSNGLFGIWFNSTDIYFGNVSGL